MVWDITPAVGHILGVNLTATANTLTRWHLGTIYRDRVSTLVKDKGITLYPVPGELFTLSNTLFQIMTCPWCSYSEPPNSWPIMLLGQALLRTTFSRQQFSYTSATTTGFTSSSPPPSLQCVSSSFISHSFFQSFRNVQNCVSGIRILHRELGLFPSALDSFQVSSLFEQWMYQ